MKIDISSIIKHKGFHLKTNEELNGDIIVLTGKNGSGKTRLLEGMENGNITTSIDNKKIPNHNIYFARQDSLVPNILNYNHTNHQEKIKAVIRNFELVKHNIDDPLFLEKYSHPRIEQPDGVDMSHKELYFVFKKISETVNKKISELTHEDISFNLSIPPKDILGAQKISEITNTYIKRINDNEYNEWRKEKRGEDVNYLTKDEIIKRFGEKPWEIANAILNDMFDGKFFFSKPDERSLDYDYNAQLLQRDGSAVSTQDLSSGEKTLFWLALTVFNSKYYENENISTPTVILFDEPDAFLHPKMVVKMFETLNSLSEKFNILIIMTTHSPTSVALSSGDSIYLVEDNSLQKIDKDRAIADLLDGVTQISLNPENRRQVFVESLYDAEIFQSIYPSILNRSKTLDPKITLSFLSSGNKVPVDHLFNSAKKHFRNADDDTINSFCELVNGSGDCQKVVAQVEALTALHSKTVRGIIDWDLKNKPTDHIRIFASEYAYSIENVTLDPIGVLLLLHDKNPQVMTMSEICGEQTTWHEWIGNQVLLQKSLDKFIEKVLGRKNNKESTIDYLSGISLKTDSEYLTMNGHSLEKIILTKYNTLKEFCKPGFEGSLKISVVNRSMIHLSKGELIPVAYEKILREVQK